MSEASAPPPGGVGTAPQVISADEAMVLAVRCLQEGRVRDAGALCRRVLEVVPGHADALHYSGILAHKAGRTVEAIALIEQSLERVPGLADWHSNHGIVLQAAGEIERALEAFERAIALEDGHAHAHNNRGVLLRVLGRYEESEPAYRRAIEIDPDYAEAYRNLAILLDVTGRVAEAVVAYSRALTLAPQHPDARRNLALAYCLIGEPERAVRVCEEWVRLEPENPAARHTLAACSGRDVPPRASDAYVKGVFDSFAATFEAKLARLHYRAPELVIRSLAASGLAADGSLDVLDTGCGTGLCGPLVKPYARRLVGVDLSAGMLDHAREKGVYDELVQAELTAHLCGQREAFDVVLSADTLVYFGELDQVAAGAASALRPAGVFIFTLEEAVDETPAYAIRPHGRYTHAAGYVTRRLDAHGFDVTIDRDELRRESGLPVAGLIVRATKRVDAAAAAAGSPAGE